MVNYGYVYRPDPEPYVDLDIQRNLPQIVSEAQRGIVSLNNAVDALPFVDERGRSECHFAESLFAQKEEAEDKLRARKPFLQKCLMAIEEEQGKRAGERATILADAGKLALDAPRDYYDKALMQQGKRCDEIKEQCQEMQNLIDRTEAALARAAKHKWPLGIPRKPFQLPDEAGVGSADDAAVGAAGIGAPAAGRVSDIDGLLNDGLLDLSLPRYPFENPESDFGYGRDF